MGPKTKNPDKTIYKNDWNNFGPAVGFAWQLPWFGKGKTNIRGGYQITYQGGGNAGNFSNAIFSNQGFVYRADTQGPTDGTYFDTRNLAELDSNTYRCPADATDPADKSKCQRLRIRLQLRDALHPELHTFGDA